MFDLASSLFRAFSIPPRVAVSLSQVICEF